MNRNINADKEIWIENKLKKMTLRQTIAQLLHIPAWSNRGTKHESKVISLIEKYGIGGVIFFQGSLESQAIMTNSFQAVSNVPLLISMDAEWGLGMRLDDAPSFPYQMALGALHKNDLIYEMGAEIARQCKRLGVHVNFAPVVDINSNPANPVIGFRSFGDDKFKVAEKALAYMKGLQDNGIMACAKHFPGHGDTSLDSHFDLPIIDKSIEEFESLEWYPFKILIEHGVKSVMMAHLFLPQIEKRVGRASSLSKSIIDLLKQMLGFEGLIFTDALDMKSVANRFNPGQLELEALKAGNDVLLFVNDIPAAIEAIENEVKKGIIPESLIIKKCQKILGAKFDLGLWSLNPVKIEGIFQDINSRKSDHINRQVTQKSLTVFGRLPRLSNKKIAVLMLSPSEKSSLKNESLAHHNIEKTTLDIAKKITVFQKEMEQLANISGAEVTHFDNIQDREKLSELIHQFEFIVVGIHGLKMKNIDHFGMSKKMKNAIKLLSEARNVVLCLFGNPYILDHIFINDEIACQIVIAYQENQFTQEETANLLFENNQSTGQMPVCINIDNC